MPGTRKVRDIIFSPWSLHTFYLPIALNTGPINAETQNGKESLLLTSQLCRQENHAVI